MNNKVVTMETQLYMNEPGGCYTKRNKHRKTNSARSDYKWNHTVKLKK